MTVRSTWTLAAAGMLAVGGLVSWLVTRDRTPPLTAETLEKAMAAWRSRGPGDYDITIQKDVDARPSEVLRTEVRSGKPVRLLLNGRELPANGSYAVPGLFDTCSLELEMASSKDPRPGQPIHAILLARFDEQLGLPVVIKRIAASRQSYVIRTLRVEKPGGQVVWENS